MVFTAEEEEKIQTMKFGHKTRLETQRHDNAMEELKLQLQIAQVNGRFIGPRGES